VQGLLGRSPLSVQAEPSANDENFGERSAVNVVARREVNSPVGDPILRQTRHLGREGGLGEWSKYEAELRAIAHRTRTAQPAPAFEVKAKRPTMRPSTWGSRAGSTPGIDDTYGRLANVRYALIATNFRFAAK
jgi:hypothetical protein